MHGTKTRAPLYTIHATSVTLSVFWAPPPTADVICICSQKGDNVLDYVPYLTEEDFARAESIDDRTLAESYPDDVVGGPLRSNGTMEVVDVRVRLSSFG